MSDIVKTLKSFEEAAKFIQDWIKVQKHNATVSINESLYICRNLQMICQEFWNWHAKNVKML